MQRTLGSFRPGRVPSRDWLEAAALMVNWVEGTGPQWQGAVFLKLELGVA